MLLGLHKLLRGKTNKQTNKQTNETCAVRKGHTNQQYMIFTGTTTTATITMVTIFPSTFFTTSAIMLLLEEQTGVNVSW